MTTYIYIKQLSKGRQVMPGGDAGMEKVNIGSVC